MQLGESISIPEFFNDEKHSEKTCPWHSEEKEAKPDQMELQAPDEDTDIMPANLGTKLGKNLGKKENKEVWVQYKADALVKWEVGVKKKEKVAQTYTYDDEWLYCYELQYAPHHLIPGNESLKGSKVVAFLGDNNVITHYKKGGISTKIKDNQSVGYDVNQRLNGVWLPSPYALSMSNKWPSTDGMKVILKRLGKTFYEQSEEFKHAYVAEAIRVSNGAQFHMRHVDYSNEVKKALNKMGEKLKLMAGGECPEASKSKDDGKFDAPKGLGGNLNKLSGNLKRFLTGSVWRAPLYTDKVLMEEYVKSLKQTKKKGQIDKIL
ncbi:hypothetical protein [Aliikangiella sp. IMCC44359]|uniref:hypothetical protein n=1 Tax=Aliikangiella sp. IMCC44359 TaxID=3459125 RepID=UPI00403AF5A3